MSQNKIKERADQLFKLGLTWNGDSYVGKGDISDFNVPYLDMKTYSQEKWDTMIAGMQEQIKNRREDRK